MCNLTPRNKKARQKCELSPHATVANSHIAESVAPQSELSTHANSLIAERVAAQASLAPTQTLQIPASQKGWHHKASLAPTRAPLAWGALSERLVPPFLQSVSLSRSRCHPFCRAFHFLAPVVTLSAERFTFSRPLLKPTPATSCIKEIKNADRKNRNRRETKRAKGLEPSTFTLAT